MKASVVIPTYNEAGNLKNIIEQILAAEDVEIVVVDDASPDGTGKLADELAKSYNVKVVHRAGKLGLSSAILEGFENASTDIVGVIDGDLQHPPSVIPKLVKAIEDGADIAVGSRKVEGGGVSNWPFWRKLVSWGAGLLARPLTPVKDSMSGLFFLKKKVLDNTKLETIGFKLGLEILVKGKYDKVVEVPYIFQARKVGDSKLGGNEFKNYIKHLIKLYRYKFGI